MFLSRVQLNSARRGARHLLSSPHALHAAVLTSFPDADATDTGRVLWRLDTGKHKAHVYVVSPERPDFTQIAEQAGWPSLPDTQTVRDYSGVLERLENGHKYGFRLTANPTHSRRSSGSEKDGRGKVYGHVTVDQQEAWLLSRQERCGFEISETNGPAPLDPEGEVAPVKILRVSDRQTLSFSRRETRVTLRVATFEGVLTVTDKEAFTRALCFGIGRAKGYGCGLMTIAPAP